MADDPLEIPIPGEGEISMAATEALAEPGNLSVAMTAMANEFGAGAAMRMRRMDQLAEDAASMWSIAMTTPTVNMGLGFRVASGSERDPLVNPVK